MIIGIGVDVIEVERMKRALDRHGDRFIARIMTPAERSASLGNARSALEARRVAKHFAVKEAASKALGTGMARGVGWHDIELTRRDSGAPVVSLGGGAAERLSRLGGSRAFVSLSDERSLVVAVVVLEG